MPKTPLARTVRSLFQTAQSANHRRVGITQVLEEREAYRINRRGFLQSAAQMAGAVAGSMALGGLANAAPSKKKKPKIAVIGAGLAGLTCAYRLRQAGFTSTIYEASPRLGGRCYTRRGFFENGQIAERGGELIDTDHTDIQDLALELGLQLDDVLAAEPTGTQPVYRFHNSPYTYQEATQDFLAIYPQLAADIIATNEGTTFDSFTARGQQLDQISIAQYIDQIVPGGHNSPLGQLLDVAYNIEYGAETSVQSALSLLYLLGYSDPNTFQIFGSSDEHYKIRGGNDQIVSRLGSILEDQIELGQPLVAITQKTDGRYLLNFAGDGNTALVDRVVLALPFSLLRSVVDFSKAGFSDLKQTAITQLGMGTNTKFQLQFKKRLWNDLGNNGDTYADTGYQTTWEVTRAQAGKTGILVDFTGGNIGASFSQGTIPQRANQFLGQLEPVLPGITRQYNGLATLDYWTGYNWTRGSYSYWKVGQYVGFSGIEGVREGNAHFCGEHTSQSAQGYLDGAVETGGRAASEIIADYL
jgi:monoamine oxidase